MIHPAAAAAHHHDAGGAVPDGGRQRQLEVGGVFVCRVLLDGDAGLGGRPPGRQVDTESRSPTSKSTAIPRVAAWSSPESAAITRSASGSGSSQLRHFAPGEHENGLGVHSEAES